MNGLPFHPPPNGPRVGEVRLYGLVVGASRRARTTLSPGAKPGLFATEHAEIAEAGRGWKKLEEAVSYKASAGLPITES